MKRRFLKYNKFLDWFHTTRAAVVFFILGLIMVISFSYTVIETYFAVQQVQREREDRIANVNTAICSLIDAVPPYLNTRIDEQRTKFHCPPYDPLDNPPVRHSTSPSPEK